MGVGDLSAQGAASTTTLDTCPSLSAVASRWPVVHLKLINAQCLLDELLPRLHHQLATHCWGLDSPDLLQFYFVPERSNLPSFPNLRLGPLEISSRAYYVMLGAGCNVFNENCSKGLLFPGFPPDLDSISRDEMEICLFARRELLYSALTCTGDLEEQGRGFGTCPLVQIWSYVWCRYSRSAHLIVYGKPTPHSPSGSRIMRRQPQTLEAGSLRRYLSDRIYE